MAASKDNKTAINLKSLNLGRRKIRFIVIKREQQGTTVSRLPMFLGADVLDNCGISDTKNLGRIHAKYSDNGMSCKLYLPNGYQIKGMRGVADKAWFYSIQGLFRVAFSFYSRNELQVLLKQMLSLWVASIDEPLLQKSLHISDIEHIVDEDVVSEESGDFSKLYHHSENRTSMNMDMENAEKIGTTGENVLSEKEIGCLSNLEKCDCIEAQHELLDSHTSSGQSRFEVSNPRSTDTEDHGECGNYISEAVENIKSKLEKVYKHEKSCSLILPYMESFSDLLIDEERNITEKQSTSFPIKLIKDYMDAKQQKIAESPQDHELAVHIVSSWVGNTFYLFKDIIKHNIDAFKQTYINSISEIPSPEEIVRTVYPSAMYSLIYLWIKGSGGDGHDDMEECKKIRSICLLILELLNGSPISGLGHWVFSII